jgi:hypothetical protein
LVFTVTVSLALVTTPPEVGVSERATGLAVVILMVEPTVALIVVFADELAAEATAGATARPNTASASVALKARLPMVVVILYVLVFLF